MADHGTLERRISVLESKVDRLLKGPQRKKDWRRTVGMFAGDDLMKEIDEEGRKIREEDRRATLESLDNE